MRLFDYLAFIAALILYIPRVCLFFLYRVLLFISKPASLYLLPALLGGLFWWQYEAIIWTPPYNWWVNDVLMHYVPHVRIREDYWYLGLFWCCFTFTLYILTGGKLQILGTILSAFPQVSRPFPPRLRLRLVEMKIKPARVSRVVPRLPRRRRGQEAPDMMEGLSEPLKRLLEPPKPVEAVSEPPEPAPPMPEPPAPPLEQEIAPLPPAPAKQGAKARPSRKPPPPALPPKAKK